MAARWKKTKIGQFLFEREGKYRPDDEIVTEIKRIDKIDFSGNFHIATKSSKTNMILVKPGDFVISGINVSKGALGIYAGEENITATIHYSTYTFDTEKINVEYFKRFLKSPEFVRLLQEQVKGGIKTEIKAKHLLPLEIDLPDIEEQQRIVSHFQSIETEDKKLQEEIACQKNLLKKIRQQILQEAIEGKLTAEWRQQNPDVEPASELLARIQVEKEQLIKDKKIKKQKSLPPIGDEEKPFDLPNGWVWCRLEKVCTFANGKAHEQFINVSGKYTLINSKFVSTDGAIIKRTAHCMSPVRKDDVTIVMSDVPNGRALARCFLVGEDDMYSLNQRIGALSPVSDMFPGFFKFLLDRNPHFLQFDDGKKQTNLRKEQILLCPLGVPPLSEQKAIVTKVEKLLALCDQMETQITASQTHSKQLMQAVLKEAFSPNSKESLAG